MVEKNGVVQFETSRWTHGLFSWSKLLYPDAVILHDNRVEILKKSLFGLKSTSEQVPYSKVSSVRLRKKILFSDVLVETTGGATADLVITGLRQKDAELCIEKLQSVCI